MKISEYQDWLEAYDREREFHRCSPGHTFIHLVEELGEVARLVLYEEGYREPAEKPERRELLAEELADAATFLFKLAYQYEIDLEGALLRNKEKAEGRFGVEQGQADTVRYLAHQERNLKKMRGDE